MTAKAIEVAKPARLLAGSTVGESAVLEENLPKGTMT